VADNLSRYRRLPNADPFVIALLLQAYADTTSETQPDKAFVARREALELITEVPGREHLRIDLLFEVERDRRLMGDAAGAVIYFDQAVTLRRTTPKLDTRTAARVDMRLAVRMFNAGDKIDAIALAEKAFNAVIDATKAPLQHWQRTTPAKSLAEIMAANADLVRARTIYEEHVFPHTDNAVAAGEAVPIDTRLDLAVLEAVYGPTAETVKTIRDLMNAGQRRAGTAKDIQERGWRSLAIAHLGLKDWPAALDAARRAFALKPAMTSQVRDEAADRRLSETFVSAAWSAQTSSTSIR
jgi:tetratricopeptide (TPR) repeat protein